MSHRLTTRSSRWRLALAAGGVAAIGIHWAVILHRRASHDGDFALSREFGRRFLVGEPLYHGGLHYPYTPTAAMSFAWLAPLEANTGILLRYAVALVCLWFTLRMLRAMTQREMTVPPASRLTTAGLTLLLGAHYVLRDLDDGGPHLILLCLLVAGIWSVWRSREALGATCFGLAASLKATAALFLPFFLWKRRWRLAALSLLATAFWTVAPAVWMAPGPWLAHERQWAEVALRSALGRPIPGASESEQRVENQALRPAVARLLTSHPKNPAEGPAKEASTASRLALLPMVALLFLSLWWSRQPCRENDDPGWLLECSAVLILALLLSPVTWVQHLVWMIPALYLISVERRAGRGWRTGVTAVMLVYALLALGLNREVVGKSIYGTLLGYGLHTLCMLLVLGVIVVERPTAAGACARNQGPAAG